MTAEAPELVTSPRQPAPELPESGRVVQVRGGIWAVAEVRVQGLPRSPADEGRPGTQHVVTLQSLQEDRLGEELSVVWELEVGHTVVPELGLPERIEPDAFDDPNVLGAFIDAARWGAVTSADAHAYQAPFRSGANIEAYQLEPLRRALSAPRTNLLLADDVGLGKTIEAGLVIQELLLRHRARSVIIVCPPSLSLKWQDEMLEKFGLAFTIVNSELMAQVRRTHGLAANPFRLFPRVIVSMAWLPTPRAQRLLRGVLADVGRSNSARRYAFDVLVVDEAHHVAPASPSAVGGGRGYAIDSRRTVATRTLAERCEHRLFLSATPHNGYSESFTALLEMIDNRRFSRGAQLNEQALHQVTVRRLKTQLRDKDFHPRVIKTLPFTPSAAEDSNFELLHRILADSARRNGRRGLDIVGLLLKKRFLSSPWAFARTLTAYEQAAATGHLPDVDDEYYAEVLGSEQSDEEEGRLEQPEFASLQRSKGTRPLICAAAGEISRLIAWGEGYQHRPDTRLTELLETLAAICRPDGQTWSNERVVIFTEYTDTLAWIVDVLQQHGYEEVLESIQGSTPVDEREQIRARFAEPPQADPIRVLVATDAAGEGIDLQAHCHRLINFDVPFNPSRLEQRIGRIDRYGQQFAPEIFYFAPVVSSSRYAGDQEFLRRIGEKVATVKEDLGAINPLIDAEIIEQFSPETSRRPAANRPAPGTDAINRAMAGEQTLNRELTDLSRTYEEQRAALHLSPNTSRRVVDTALRLTAQPPLREIGDADTDAEVFAVPAVGNRWQPAVAGLATRLHPEVLRPITFDPDAARGRTDLVHVHLGHPLMAKSARILRSALVGSDTQINRVTAVVVPDLPVSCVAAVSRLVLVGRGGLRLHEEVFLTGVRFRGQQLAEDKAQTLIDRALDDPDLQPVGAGVRAALADDWNLPDSALRTRLDTAVQRRAQARQRAVADSLDVRRDSDIDRAAQIFAAFRQNLNDTLADLAAADEAQAMMLWSDEAQQQRRRDVRAMRDRLRSLDDEERRETTGLRERYADIRPFTSTAAVVFAITEQDAATWDGAR